MALIEKLNHVSEALDNLVQQFKGSGTLQLFITSWVNEVQELEGVWFDLLNDRWIVTAVGEQLDGLGSIVGESRQGRSDEVYRVAIQARIAINKGSGTPEEIIDYMSVTVDQLNQLTDGNMEASGTSAWYAFQATLSKETTSPKEGLKNLKILATSAAGARYPTAEQVGILISGDTYNVTAWARSDGTQVPYLYTGTIHWTGTNSTEWQPVDVEFVANDISFKLGFAVTNPTGSEYVEWDDIKVTKEGIDIELAEFFPASLTVKPVMALPQESAEFLKNTLDSIKAAGVNIDLIYGIGSDDQLEKFDTSGKGFDQAPMAGAI
jgi:hypothetical protein